MFNNKYLGFEMPLNWKSNTKFTPNASIAPHAV